MRTETQRFIPKDIELIHPFTKKPVTMKAGWKILSRTEWRDPNCKHQGVDKALSYRDTVSDACTKPCVAPPSNWAAAWEAEGGVRDYSATGKCDKGNAWLKT